MTSTSTSSDIVLIPGGNYRKIAQRNWGLTDEQMKGMHVHHRIPRSKGGTNDPSNLYVCSPWFHYAVWHLKDPSLRIVLWANAASKLTKGSTGCRWSDETKEKIRLKATGRKVSEESKNKRSERMKGSTLSEEWSDSIKRGRLKTKRSPCPHCGTLCQPHTLKRWHLENCKHKQ